MNRRNFFGRLFGGFVAACMPIPAHPWKVIWIPRRKMMMARVRISKEALSGLFTSGVTVDAITCEYARLIKDLEHEERR